MSENAGLSRRDFLRAAGTVGLSGGLLGAYAGQALGHNGEDHAAEVAMAQTEHMSSHGGNSTVGEVDTARFDPGKFLRDFYWGEERREGLAIGAAFALGEAALGAFLVVGFTLHNITEGVGIAAPILKERPRLAHFLWLALLGGGPAIVGTWIGGFAFSNLLAAVFLAVGAGAILQVIYEVTRLLLKDSGRSKSPALSAPNLGGLLTGVAVMYATALMVSV